MIASDVGGLPAALGQSPAGRRPGVLVPAGDAEALAVALRDWLSDPGRREMLRSAAGQRRLTLTGWSVTADAISRVLAGVTP